MCGKQVLCKWPKRKESCPAPLKLTAKMETVVAFVSIVLPHYVLVCLSCVCASVSLACVWERGREKEREREKLAGGVSVLEACLSLSDMCV